MKNKKITSIILLLLWMALIFFMSAKTGDESTKQSDLVIRVFTLLGIDLNSTLGDIASIVIRKGAHFTEYMILGFLFMNVFIKHEISKKKVIIYSIIGVFLYACSDEFHQLFVPGRAGKFTDVLIDTSGGIFSTIILIIKDFFMKNR